MVATAVNNVVQPAKKKVKLFQVPILQNISTPAETVSITIHRIGMKVERWWSDNIQSSGWFYLFNIGGNKRSSWVTWVTERRSNQPSTTPTTASSYTTKCCSAGRDREFNSLYAIHRIGMGVGKWWSDGVQNSVCFYVFNMGTNKRYKFRYDKRPPAAAEMVSIAHCMLSTRQVWTLESGGKRAYRELDLYVFNIGTTKESSCATWLI